MPRKQSRSLGPANNEGVPAEELVLAEMIANAEHSELTYCTGGTGVVNVEGLYVPCGTYACAIGAYLAFKPAPGLTTNDAQFPHFREMASLDAKAVWRGNDGWDDEGLDLAAYDLGAAYRAYHLESDG